MIKTTEGLDKKSEVNKCKKCGRLYTREMAEFMIFPSCVCGHPFNEGLKKEIRRRIEGQLVHANFEAAPLASDEYRGCVGHKNRHIDLLTEELFNLLATHASEERKALADKVREAISQSWDIMTNRVFNNTMKGKNSAFNVTNEDWSKSYFTKEEFVDQVLSMLES